MVTASPSNVGLVYIRGMKLPITLHANALGYGHVLIRWRVILTCFSLIAVTSLQAKIHSGSLSVFLCLNKWHQHTRSRLDMQSQTTSLSPGRYECDSENIILNFFLMIDIFRSSHYNALWWMQHYFTDGKFTLVQVMASCRQATCHYLSHSWLSSLSPDVVARPQWVMEIFYMCINIMFFAMLTNSLTCRSYQATLATNRQSTFPLRCRIRLT